MKTHIRNFLVRIAAWHPMNKLHDRPAYPQLWYCWPRWMKRVKWAHRLKCWMCEKLTGHEWSNTEWGYGGGKYADRWCRWCDCMKSIPIAESPPPNAELAEFAEMLKKPLQ